MVLVDLSVVLFSVKTTEDDRIDSLLSRDFLKKCEDNFRSAFKWSDDASHPGGVFQRKHLNIVDPLKANNNLGRSVNQGASSISDGFFGILIISCVDFWN